MVEGSKKENIILLRKQGKSYREIQKELNCSRNAMSIEAAVDLVLEIDSDDDLYYSIYKESYLADNKLTEWMDFQTLQNFFKTII
jgi:hypothetical protein